MPAAAHHRRNVARERPGKGRGRQPGASLNGNLEANKQLFFHRIGIAATGFHRLGAHSNFLCCGSRTNLVRIVVAAHHDGAAVFR